MSSFWKAEKSIQDRVLDLVASYHPDLALVSEGILVVFREKAGSSQPFGVARKATPLLHAIAGDEELSFILEVPANTWETLSSRERDANLDYLLCGCSVEEDSESGTTKLSTVKPDHAIYRDNFERFGMWFPQEVEANREDDKKIAAALANTNVINDMIDDLNDN